MEPFDLLAIVVRALGKLRIDYFVTGSLASMTHGETRYTNDIDIVVWLSARDAIRLCDEFPPPDYYCSVDAALEAVKSEHQFNIIHPASGLKVDVIMPPESEFKESCLNRRQSLTLDNQTTAYFASPEDVMLSKLRFYKLGESDKHIRDILGVLKVQKERIDREYIQKWCDNLSLNDQWNLILERESEQK